ncbi:restriction endonuclease [Actinomyces oris]|uniref:Restriction endonuclease n=1 Tax=Actinomyces oris TaxID=544580 RepID=A0A1Q8VR10_9ACTO|nr:restriction endonuclease [Actinomyces oris]
MDDLIRDLCPDGVEHKTLGEVGEFIRGNGIKKSDFTKQGYPCIHYGQIHTHYGISAAETISHIPPEQATRLRKAQPGDLVIATTSEDDDAVGKATAWLGTTPVAVGGDSYIFRHSMEPKYVSYFFSSTTFSRQRQTHITGSKVRRITAPSLSKIIIPAPPIEIQHEITRTLDQFIQLEAELEAELEARQYQYNYYLNELLSFKGDPNTPWRPLAQLGTFHRGKRFVKTDYSDYGIPCIHYGEIYTRYGVSTSSVVSNLDESLRQKLRFAQPGDVILVDVGEVVDDVGRSVAWIGNEPVAIHDHSYAFRSTLNPTFVSYVMRTDWFTRQKAKHVARTKVKTLLIDGFSKIHIPVPPRTEQDRIVEKLNQFDTLVNDLSSGLPAEIEARRKQYEYYRDRLLTFPEKK